MSSDPFGMCAEPECNDEEPPKELPGLVNMAKSLAGTAGDVLKGVVAGQGMLVTQETYDERMAICETCPLFRKEDKRCTECGCYMEAKARLKKAKCPIDKWGMID